MSNRTPRANKRMEDDLIGKTAACTAIPQASSTAAHRSSDSSSLSENVETEQVKAQVYLDDVIGGLKTISDMLHERNETESEIDSSLGILKVDDLQGYRNIKMNEETLPPSPNWYLSNVLTCLDQNTIAYGARNHVVIGKYPPESTSKTPEVSIISNAHKERVNIIASSYANNVHQDYWHCLASAGDDSAVKIWNWDSLTPLLQHNSHTEGVRIFAMDWSRVDPNLVVSADEQGTIVCWDLLSNTSQRLNFGKLVPTCLSCCPHKRELIAVGTRSGVVCIIDLKGSGKMQHHMRGHDTEVVSLSWCPVAYNVLQPNTPHQDMLLASAARKKAIYVWRAGGDGRCETMICLPSVPLTQEAPGSQEHRTRLGATDANVSGGWTCVSWPEPYTLLSSSLFGELMSCNLHQDVNLKSAKATTASKLWKLVHACHSRGLFSIAHVPWCDPQVEEKVLNEHEISESGDFGLAAKEIAKQLQIVWTNSHDRRMVACDWKTGKILTDFPTLGGFVNTIATSPLDSNRIAFGVGDGTVRVWNVSNCSSIEITMSWQEIKGRVMALAWHPAIEGWLAYGTSEGRVGLYDVSCGKPPILFHPYHRHSVNKLCWGPPVCKTDAVARVGNYLLYSCVDGEIVLYDPEKPSEEPYSLKETLQNPDVSTQKNFLRTDIAWKPDFSCLAVGNEDGTVSILFAPNLKLVSTLFAHKKLIQCLAWHPGSTAIDTSYSPYQHWLAVGSDESFIKVFDLSQLFKGEEEEVEMKPTKLFENCITLSGHLKGVVSMCWSPHIGGHLVSVSFDNTAQVWNVPAQQPIAKYCSHSDHVCSCAWSPLDPDLVITGASDFTLRIWKVSKHTQVLPSERSDKEAASSEVSDEKYDHPIEFAKTEKGILTAGDQLVKVCPHYSLDGQPATVQIHDIQTLELQDFPGPLVRDRTHKTSVINFCQRKIKTAEEDPELYDRESVILLWRFLVLLLKQNGIVVETDKAELLLSHTNQNSSIQQTNPSPQDLQAQEISTNVEEITNRFREFLLCGNTNEALEWAMENSLWGHALFLASKMDQTTYGQVMVRFANGLSLNDPLQTLYQMMSGQQPAAVTCCADEKWGDWKPHLAMILSNSSQRPELSRKAVMTLGDTLGARGCLHASHFCYLMANQEFGDYSHKSSKIVLIGSSHHKSFDEFATIEAIQMTEIYHYACQLAGSEEIAQFQMYKYLYALRLAELEMPAEAIHYIEVIAGNIVREASNFGRDFIRNVVDLAEKLKLQDPIYSSADPTWLQELQNVLCRYEDAAPQDAAPQDAAPQDAAPQKEKKSVLSKLFRKQSKKKKEEKP